MTDNAFDTIENVLQLDPNAGFEFLVEKFRLEKNYPRLFEARLMKKRHELGLPLILTEPWDDLPDENRRAYEEAFLEAAREVGHLYLADGDIPRAWSYFRAIGDSAPIAAAIENLDSQQGNEALIEIAFHERVHPRKGFELVLASYGICRAISYFDQYPDRKGRDESLRLLVRTLYGELAENLKRTIAEREGLAPQAEGVSALLAGRDWLFEDNAYYIDTSHVASVLRFTLELTDAETLGMAVDLTDYGKRLSPLFQYRGEPPFEDIYVDYGLYLCALLGQEVEAAIAHFRRKVAESDPKEIGTGPAQVLVGLLARLGRYAEAIDVSLEHLRDVDATQLACPTVLQLCQLARDYGRLMELSRQRGDLLSFAAAAIQK